MACYAGKQEKPFWFSSLDQIVQFGAIIFGRTFKNYFGQFVWIEKSHYSSRVSLHEPPTKKMGTSRVGAPFKTKIASLSNVVSMKILKDIILKESVD